MTDLPLLDDTRCTGCGDCVVVCPADCLEGGFPIPWLPRPGDCVSCSLCALICPVDAICMEAVAELVEAGTEGEIERE